MRRVTWLVAVALVSVVLAAAPAVGVPGLDLSVREWPDEAGVGVVDPSGKGQLLSVEVKPGRTTFPEFSVRNTSNTRSTITVFGDAGDDRVSVVYRDDRWRDVTAQVVAGTYELEVPGGKRRALTAEITVAPDRDTGPQGRVWIMVVDEHGITDRVGVRVVVPPVRVWATNYRGTIRCEATFPRRYVRPGDLSGAAMSITNLSDEPQSVLRMGFLEIRDPDGSLLDDTDDLWRYGPSPEPIAPGGTVDAWTFDTRVRWPGELRVRAVCAGMRLPAVRLQTVSLDGDVGVSDAITRAVAVPGSPFQTCEPGSQGEPTSGVLRPPDGQDLPPMTVRCWARVRDEEGFAAVDLFMVSPDDQPAYELGESPFESEPEIPDDGPNLLAARWSFVVTPHRVRPWRSATVVHALGDGMSSTYELQDGEWRWGGGGGCGYYSYFLGFLGEVFLLDWYTACDPGDGAGDPDVAVPSRILTATDPGGEVRTRTLP